MRLFGNCGLSCYIAFVQNLVSAHIDNLFFLQNWHEILAETTLKIIVLIGCVICFLDLLECALGSFD